MAMTFSTNEDFALQLDREDPLREFRNKFHLPVGEDGKPVIYFAGNSLGLMPKSARQIVEEELDNWAKLGVDAHHATGTPWYSYHEALREPTARLVGAKPLEVICMNSLTVNLHLMMATFYRPTKSRFKILMEAAGIPFRYLRDQNADRSSRARSERRACAGAPAQRRVHSFALKTFSISSRSMPINSRW